MDVVKTYEKSISIRIFLEIAYNSIMILSYLFTLITWVADGEVFGALSRVLPLAMCFKILYHLGTETGKLAVNQKLVFQAVCRIPQHLLGEEMRLKVFIWLLNFMKKMTMVISVGGVPHA